MELATTKGRPLAARGPMRTSAPTDGGDHAGRGLLDAPDLPPGGKVAFAKQMTDEGAEGRTVTIPVGTLISLASLDSFPLEGGSRYGAHLCVRPARPCDDL